MVRSPTPTLLGALVGLGPLTKQVDSGLVDTLDALVHEHWQQGMLAGLGAAMHDPGRWLAPSDDASVVGGGASGEDG